MKHVVLTSISINICDLHFYSFLNKSSHLLVALFEKGRALTWNTQVRDIWGSEGITYERRVELHLRLMRLIQVSKCSWKVISVIWDLVVSPIVLPEAKGMLFTWLSKHFPLLDKEARVKLSGILTFCSDSLKDVPGYDRFYRASMGNDTITRFLSTYH